MSAHPAAAGPTSDPAEARELPVLGAILAFSILSTAIHYTHNFIAVSDYPQTAGISDTVVRIGVLVTWPLLTATGLYGYRLYTERRYRPAHLCLLLYSLTGLLTFGHFVSGNPDIPAFFYATLFTDGIGGVAVIAFVVWSVRAHPPEVAAATPVRT
jgi:hypothetical protein